MAEILSQNEIDQLMQMLSSGRDNIESDILESNGPKINKYDFRTANRIPRDQMRTLNMIYENYSRLLSTQLTGTLGVMCDVNLASVEEQTYYEFTNSVPANSVLAVMKMPPLQGSVLMQISPEVAYTVLEGLLGGVDVPSIHRRVFTEIDLVILEKIIRQLLPLNNESWDKIVKIKTQLDGIETNIQFAQIVSPSETIAIITLRLCIGENESLINMCIPHSALEPVAKILNSRLLVAGRNENKPSESFQEPILHKLQTTPIPLKAILSETTITVGELRQLQPGDVIQLDSQLGDPIQINIGHVPRLIGQLGTRNKRYAIRVTGFVYEEDDQHE